MRLTDAQVQDLTSKVRPSAQARVLLAMGIPYRRRPDGSIVVLLSDLQHAPTQTRSAPASVRLPPTKRVLVRERRQVDPARIGPKSGLS